MKFDTGRKRIGRADYHLIEEYWEELFGFASDDDPKVRLSFIWASEKKQLSGISGGYYAKRL